ncbi:major capsid protein [Salimicrobium jeotgali]|uniref:major capsid protein n=1 Tax=Salimicrobium jeotgali TaxID=1230341 RepID=UPI000C858733|nr:major capsid protein [Salimicrobium jeotgali]
MPNIHELFSNKVVLDYLQNRQYPSLMGETLFPEVKRDSLEFEYVKGGNNTPVVASVHSFDTETELGSREAEKAALELALIKRKMRWNEKDIIALQNPRTQQEQQYLTRQVFNDVDTLVAGVRARVEAMRMEVLANGTVTLAENGLSGSVDYGVPSDHKEALTGTARWTDTANSTPLEDLERWQDALDGQATRALTSKKVLNTLLKHPHIIEALYGKGSQRFATRNELNAFLQQRDLPQIVTYDQKYRKQNEDGSYTSVRYFPENKFTLFGDGKLGEAIYGPTAEEVRLVNDPTVDTNAVGNVLAMVYDETRDPVGTYTKAVATALPSFPAADQVFQAQPID